MQVVVSDASHANEDLVGTTPTSKVKTEFYCNQGGKLILMADPSIVDGEDCEISIL